MNISDFKNKMVLVMGLGKFGGGVDSAVFAAKTGAKVIVTDLADADSLGAALDKLSGYDIEYRLGEHVESDFDSSSATDIIIVNPAVPPGNKYLKSARQAGKTITSQIEIFFQLCPADIVGITGANGKSTTTSLTAHLLEAGSRKVWLGGNIGNLPLLEILDQITADDIVVLEISSFQADQLAATKQAPSMSLITNLTPNHLDRHGTFGEYCKAKENIFKFQKLDENHPAVSIFNSEDEIASQWFKKYSSQTGRVCHEFSADDVEAGFAKEFKLAGRMNLSNLAAAITTARQFDIPEDRLIEAVSTFRSLPNRLEMIAEVNRVKWYDDSIATTPVSTIAALEAFDAPRIIIAGGYDKQIPFDELAETISKKAKAAILIGQTAPLISEAILTVHDSGVHIEIAGSMEEAVAAAARVAEPGDIVLMSPACASYDMFENYKHRSRIFAESVNKLKIDQASSSC